MEGIVQEICRRSWAFGVSVLLSPRPYFDNDGAPCGGYFIDEPEPMLAVAWGNESKQSAFEILLHEYCHLTQWAEQSPLWTADCVNWWGWLSGERVPNVQAKIIASRELEADCERRTLRLARELGADIDPEQYARKANAYIHFYNVVAELRKWNKPGRPVYKDAEVIALCNPTLDKDFSKTPAKLKSAITDFLIRS